MRNTLTILLLLITLTGNAQMIITLQDSVVYHGKNVYQIGISLSDTTIKTVNWAVLSGSGQHDGNAGLAFCFGHPKYFNDNRLPDTTGILYVNNPDIIYKRGSGYVWKVQVVAYDAKTKQILYRGFEELMFPNLKK